MTSYLTMVISRHFRHRPGKLCHFQLLYQISFEAGVDDFALARFEAVNQWRNGTVVVHVAE